MKKIILVTDITVQLKKTFVKKQKQTAYVYGQKSK